MRTYEHLIVRINSKDDREVATQLDEYGEQGWKLMTAVPVFVPAEYLGNGETELSYEETRFIFRRPVVEGRT